VFLFHYGAAFSERISAPRAITTLLQNGNMGVSFFFVLSGFILTYTYQGRLNSRYAVADYLFARFSRLYPVYLLALVIALPVLTHPLGLIEALKVLLMVQAWTFPMDTSSNAWITQAWTLSVELFFYAIFPFALPVVGRLKPVAATMVATGVGAAICVFGIAKIAPGTERIAFLPRSFTPPLPILHASEFLLGMLACAIYLNRSPATWCGAGGWKASLTALAVLAILASTTSPQVTSLATVLFPVLIIQLASGEGAMARFLSRPAMLVLGGASYAFYITQGPAREWVRALIPSPLDAALNPIIAVVVATAIFLLWEQPAQRWLRSVHKRGIGFAVVHRERLSGALPRERTSKSRHAGADLRDFKSDAQSPDL
jgi:peptidoglycan/LPS O-acetylase OafA/YrhL